MNARMPAYHPTVSGRVVCSLVESERWRTPCEMAERWRIGAGDVNAAVRSSGAHKFIVRRNVYTDGPGEGVEYAPAAQAIIRAELESSGNLPTDAE